MPHPARALRHQISRASRTYLIEGPEVTLARIIRSLPEGPKEGARMLACVQEESTGNEAKT
jgi:hypothetical protein